MTARIADIIAVKQHRCPIKYRMRYLPMQIAATRHKLRALETEARRLGMFHLLADTAIAPGAEM